MTGAGEWGRSMSTLKAPAFFVQTENGDLHAYWDPALLRISLHENKGEKVRVFSRHHGVLTLKYTEVSCMECFDHDDKCQECCPHDEHDHGICLSCGLDRTDHFVGLAESAFEGDR